jgi:hypothetical protein
MWLVKCLNRYLKNGRADLISTAPRVVIISKLDCSGQYSFGWPLHPRLYTDNAGGSASGSKHAILTLTKRLINEKENQASKNMALGRCGEKRSAAEGS